MSVISLCVRRGVAKERIFIFSIIGRRRIVWRGPAENEQRTEPA